MSDFLCECDPNGTDLCESCQRELKRLRRLDKGQKTRSDRKDWRRDEKR